MARESWGSRLGFVLAAAGSAIGLGTLWRLPYAIGENGGGAFVIIFIAFTILIAMPLFILELSFGRWAKRGLIGAFGKLTGSQNTHPLAHLAIICSLLIAGWYAVIAGWSLNYVVLSILDAFSGKSAGDVATMFDTFRASASLNILWQLVFIATTATIVSKGIQAGIEKFSKILTSTLFVFLILLFAYSVSLDGFREAAHYILYPDWNVVTGTTLLKALGLALFSLSVGQGIMVTYGSYMKDTDDIPKTAAMVTGSILFISIIIALMIFPMVFTYGLSPAEGEGLMFKLLPFVFGEMPGSVLISTCFFLLLAFAAITSSIGQFEVVVAAWTESKGYSRKKATWMTAGIAVLIGLPAAISQSDISLLSTWRNIYGITYLQTCYLLTDYMLILFSMGLTFLWAWKTPQSITSPAILKGSKSLWVFPLWLWSVRVLVPLALLAVFLRG